MLRRAAAERAREEAAAKERRLVSLQLHSLGEASQTFTSAPSPKGSAASLQSHAGFQAIIIALSICLWLSCHHAGLASAHMHGHVA